MVQGDLSLLILSVLQGWKLRQDWKLSTQFVTLRLLSLVVPVEFNLLILHLVVCRFQEWSLSVV